MRGSGYRTLTGLTVLVVALCSMLSTATAWAGDGTDVEPSFEPVINFPAFPNAGGPYITQATVRPDAVSGAGATEVYLVFNEAIDGTTVATTDFAATGFTFTGVTVNGNVVTLDVASGAASGDEVQIVEIGAIGGLDGSFSTDITPFLIGEGPVVIGVQVFNYENQDPTDDEVLVIFDANVEYGGGDSEDNTFNSTPEFNGALLDSDFEAVNFTDDGIRITQNALSTDDFNTITPGVTKLLVTNSKIVWSDLTSTDNNVDLKFPVDNIGPHLVGAYYNDAGTGGLGDDHLWAVFNEAVDPASIVGNIMVHFDGDVDGGGWIPTGGLISSAFPGLVTNSLLVTNITALGPPTEGVDQIANHDDVSGTALDDYQGLGGTINVVDIDRGPGIIRASYDDHQTTTRTDDDVYVWISETVTDVDDVDVSDFDFLGFDESGLTLTVVAENLGSLCRLTFNGFSNTDFPVPGARIIALAANGILGTLSGDELGTTNAIRIEDESRPWTLDINEDLDLTYDRWNGVDTDSVFIAWSETGGDDSDQYFLFYSATPTLDNAWMNANLGNAIPLGNLHPEATDGLIRIGFLIVPGVTPSTDGIILNEGDQMRVILAAADFQGNVAHVQDDTDSALLLGPFIVGPLCAPRDFISDASTPSEADSSLWDSDVIHVVGDSVGGTVEHFVYGDSLSIACDADSVLVYDGPDPNTDNLLGATPIGPGGSFPPIPIGYPEVDCIYVFAKQDIEFSEGTPIIFDRVYPEVQAELGTPFADFIFDPWNPYRIYNDGDWVNIRLLASDPVSSDICFVPFQNRGGPIDARNALLHIWGDFTGLDSTPGNITGFGTPADSILFTSLGADLVDNDGDWEVFTDVDGNGVWDPGEPLNDDVGIDGIDGTNDDGEGDGLMTWGDPWVDENASGAYDYGETFLNAVTDEDGSSGRLIFDPGEPDLDSNDADEFGWYEVRASSSSVRGTVMQGYPLANPRPEAQLDPYTPVTIYIEDNGIDGARRPTSPDRILPFTDAVPDSNRTLAHRTVHNGGDPERRFAAVLDLREPTHAEITELVNETGPATDGADNLIVPGNPVYNLGRYVDFTSSSLSDDDVLYSRVRIRPSLGAWVDLTLDPSPASGSDSDGNGDGFPGGMAYDEDADSTAAQANAFDDDEDGDTDEEGEGIDFSDREVATAAQDSTADDAAANGNGLHAQNDYTDNDNDAFFVYDSYANGGLVGGGDVGKIYWYNIDESRTNNFDDDNDGTVDEADEDPESVDYGNGENDDNEDGIADGEAVEVPLTGFSALAIADPVDPRWSPPTPGPGVSGSSVFVDAAHVLGTRPMNGNSAENEPFYANELSYGEVVGHAYEVMTLSSRLFPVDGYDFGGGADSASTNGFNWFDTHTSENIDFELLSEIYGLVADGATQHQFRAVAYDKAGNVREPWSEPVSFTLDLTPPPANIPGCDGLGDPPTDFADVRPAIEGIQVYDAGKHPDDYTLTATSDDDAVSVIFEASSDPEFGTIDFSFNDISEPFTAEWPGGGMYTVNNYPAANADTVYFRALAQDEFGNTTPIEEACILTVVVIDGTNPTTEIVQIHNDDDLHDGTCVPPDSSIHLYAEIWDNDEDANGDTLDWVGGLDVEPGDRNVDDDGNDGVDEDDVDGDGIFTWGVDDPGVDGIPGTDDDEWNGSSFAGNFGETDDYITNDVYKIIFEYNPVGDAPDLGWLPIETVHGDTFSTGGQTVDWTEPVFATWNTLDLETGDYDIRAWSCDIEGNCDSLTAFLTTVCIRAEPLRAYIQPEVCQTETTFDLYAVHYLHDYEIDKVRFEYFFDVDGDNCATPLDAGSTWNVIALDDDDTGRGDAVLYLPSPERVEDAAPIHELLYVGPMNTLDDGDGGHYRFWDPEQDGYSPRDPVVYDGNDDGIFQDDDDSEVIGEDNEIPEGVTLTDFADDEFYADNIAPLGGGLTVREQGWILRENELNGINAVLDLWTVTWDATGVEEGNYLVHAIAIDEFNQEDVLDYDCYDPAQQNPEEVEAVSVDSEDPDAEFTEITLPDGTVIDVSNPAVQPYVAGSNKWLEICAAGSDDIARVLFELSLDGGVTWDTLDVNNDDDFYADIDDTLGFQALGADEIFNDLNGNFLWDGPEVDFVRYPGNDGDVDTPLGFALIPLTSEDEAGDSNGDLDNDDDGDGLEDEDPSDGDASPQDYEAPFCVYLDISSLMLWADVNALFRATASDQLCELFREDPTPALLSVILGENMAPEADVVRAEDQDGVEMDVWTDIMDDDGVVTIGSETDTMRVFVTAEDITAIVEVDLYYRLDPNCYPDLPYEENLWRSMSAEGWTVIDAVYPYDFNVATDLIPDGTYQFFPRAVDEGGNATLPPRNPWAFKKFAEASTDFALVTLPQNPDSAAVGDEYTIFADLIDPSQEEAVSVNFYFAPRRLNEPIDPTLVQPLAPYTSPSLDETVLSEQGGCDGITLTINGELGTCHEDLSEVPAPTALDFELDEVNNAIVFGARPLGTDEILVSYNFGSWEQIHTGDEFAPYSVEWTAEEGGVPDPSDFGWDPEHTDAYDLIATANFDINGDWLFDEDCDHFEELASEGSYLILLDTDRPLVQIYGLSFSEEYRENQDSYPDWNWPGNPLFTGGDDVNDDTDWDNAFILSGKETDVFVVAADQGGGEIDSVDLTIIAENPETGDEDEISYDMTLYSTATTIDIPISMYPIDYPQWDPADIENVWLYVSADSGGTFPYKFEMVLKEDATCYQALGRFFVGTVHFYEFEIDLIGDTQERVVDARNNGVFFPPFQGTDEVSVLRVPELPFWYQHIDSATDFYPSRVHHALATATDDSGNTGNNLNSGTPDEPEDSQGPVVYIYDVEPPVVQAIFANDSDNRPLQTDRITPNLSYLIWSTVNDDPYEDFDVLRVDQVQFQYSPNQGGIWLDMGTDTDITDGWNIPWSPVDPSTDGYDNDVDGDWDEDDEKVATIWIRTIARDAGYNSGYSDAQDPEVILVLVVDAAEPSACADEPFDGSVYAYEDAITISGTAVGDWIPAVGGDDIAEMRFEARFSNLFFVDNVYNGVGHAGDYDNGIDEIWQDTNSNKVWDGGDAVIFAGQDGGAETPDGSATNRWFTLDPTPSDNSDDPWLTSPNNGDAYTMTWTPIGSLFTHVLEEGLLDEYVRIRMVATDSAGNEDTDADDFPPCEKLIILNDNAENNPRAYVMTIGEDWVDPIETLVIPARDPIVVGGVVSTATGVSFVNVYMEVDGVVTLIGISYLDGTHFEVNWNAQDLPQGDYILFATVVDTDQNESSQEDATRIHVRIDREGPGVEYACVDGTEWVQATSYVDDGIVDHSSFAVHPDEFTFDVLFCVNTPDDDVTEITLQWRFANDPEGLWRHLDELLDNNGDTFDYEPNLNFEVDGETRHVWRLHVEDWADQLLQEGRMQFRALAVDQAGNSNALDALVNAQELTADGTGPTIYDWNDDSVTNQVEVGTTVHFEITTQDDWTDVVATQLQYRNLTDGGDWTIATGDVEPDGVQIDTDFGLWVSEFDWTAPVWVVHDTEYEFRLIAWDSAGNDEILSPPHAFVITVEDNAAPDRTKLVDIFAVTNYTTEETDGGDLGCSPPDPSDLQRVHDVWYDADLDGIYDVGSDFLVSEGLFGGVQDPFGLCGVASVGAAENTYPRTVGEGYLNDPAERNEVKVAREVTLVGRTWADDDGIDAGIAYVTFWAQPLDGDDNPVGDPIIISRDEVAPNFPLYYWHVTWNTLDTDVNGDRVWADGRYRLGAHAIDQEGNEEDLTSLDWTAAVIVVDNEAPEATMDADATTEAIENDLTIERNEWFTLYSRVLELGTANENTTEDNTVTWYYKRHRDLNMTDSWGLVPNEAGVTPEDGNPDETRPYSFDVMVGELTDPTDPVNLPFLAVGENYDFIMEVTDEVNNATDHLTAYADSSTIGRRYVKVHIVDTIPPHLEFVEAVRALPERDGGPFGDGDVIPNPTRVHAQAFESITARLLTGHRDTEYVEFVYRLQGETAWNLIDADLSSPDGINWVLGNWDLRALQNGQWYEIAAVGVDNIGNVDQNPDILLVYVDYEAPEFVMIHPDPNGNRWCDFEVISNDGDIHALDLVIQVDRGAEGIHDDVYDVIWEWKLSSADSTQWSERAVASGDELYDDTLNYYSNTIDLANLEGTELYDLRVTLVDEAGNIRRGFLYKQVYDETDPDYVAISNISWEGDDTTQDPNDQGGYTDVTAGTLVEIFGTASDDEASLPNERDPQTGAWYETAIAEMQFQVAVDIDGDGVDNDGEVWRDLGVVQFDPDSLDDPSAQTASVLWNTTGLAEDQYLLRVIAEDECGNSTISPVANVRVTDNEPPIARVVCWDADQQPHGDNPPSLVTVYALAESDPSIVDVQFQYNIVDAGETSPAGPWVNFGVPSVAISQDDYTTETLWYSTIDLTDFDATVTQLWVRALSKDDAGNRYGDNPEDVVPTMLADIVREFDGTVTLEAVRSTELENGSPVVEDVQVMIEAVIPGDATTVIVTVDMATADQTPRLIVLAELNNPDEYPSDDNPTNYSPGMEGGLTRSLNDPTVWRGEIELFGFDEDCYHYELCVTGLDGESGIAKWIDHAGAFIREYDVTRALGTNGIVVTPAHGDLGVTVEIHPFAIDDETCLLVSPTWAPLVSHDQAMFLTAVENTAYHIQLIDSEGPFQNGYEAEVVIEYSQADIDAALDGARATESDVTVRRWDLTVGNGNSVGAWTGNGISHVQVDTTANTVTFRVSDLSPAFEDLVARGDDFEGVGNIFQLFVPEDSAPVFFASVWPNSPYVSDWWTDADPQFVVYLKNPGGSSIDTDNVELLIDGVLWASWLDGAGDAEFVRGNGKARLEYATDEGTLMVVTYFHSNFAIDWLANGPHTLNVRYKSDNGDWLSGDQVFNVDQISPYIEFDGGWVDNPELVNIRGYMNPANDSLHVALFDAGTGVLFKHDHKWYLPDNDCDNVIDADELQFDPMPIYDTSDYGTCWHEVDWGVKYDLWLVDMPEPQEDDQNDIDEIEERVLIHPGTADELAPWVNPPLSEYSPATDTLRVPIPVLGGGLIGDGDILEIVWYAQKRIEANNDGPGEYCYTDSFEVNGTIYYIWDTECQYDEYSQEMHLYQMGVTDWASNTGSKYVEQRFIVDMAAPNCQILSPSATVDPSGDLQIHAVIVDDGAGIDDSAITIRVIDPNGEVLEVEELEVEDGVITGHIHGPLTRGEYQVELTAHDRLGNRCNVTKTVRVEAAVLALSGAYAYPNPVNPAETNARIQFGLSKAADVTVKVYDFGGQFVRTLASKQRFESTDTGFIEWGGEAEDGTDLANGTYIVRVTATDGARTEEANLKVVIWRE